MSDVEQKETESIGLLEESAGVKSSKRFFGAVLIIAGCLLLASVGIVAIFYKVSDPMTTLDSGRTLIIVGASLLGVGVLEGLGEGIGKAIGKK